MRKLLFIALLTVIPIILGLCSLWLYKKFGSDFIALRLYEHKKEILSITAAFSFTLMGLITAFLAVFFLITQSLTFKRYVKNGYLDVFLGHTIMTIILLASTFFLSLLSFSKYYLFFLTLFVLIITNIVQVTIIVASIILALRSAHKEK